MRSLIVDDWHKANLSSKARADFLLLAAKTFGKVFLCSDPTFDLREFATQGNDQIIILQFEHASLPAVRL